MLIIEIGLGIVLGFILLVILLVNLDKVILLIGGIFALGLFAIFIGCLVWLFFEKRELFIAFSSIAILAALVHCVYWLGALVSKKTILTVDEVTGLVFCVIIVGFSIFSICMKYLENGDVSEEVIRISPFFIIILIASWIFARRVSKRKIDSKEEVMCSSPLTDVAKVNIRSTKQ